MSGNQYIITEAQLTDAMTVLFATGVVARQASTGADAEAVHQDVDRVLASFVEVASTNAETAKVSAEASAAGVADFDAALVTVPLADLDVVWTTFASIMGGITTPEQADSNEVRAATIRVLTAIMDHREIAAL